jgi:methylated-DNA-protein-cysteine methyltransferase related protein
MTSKRALVTTKRVKGGKLRAGGLVPFKPQVLAVVSAIPEGRVTTYGTIAQYLKISPRQVAFVLARLTTEESESLPWFRVVAAKGVVSTVKLGGVGRRQIKRLRDEGIEVGGRNQIQDFQLVAWSPR